ncbi:uncharacterized protein LOC124681946 isoform X2 [Lolium rigidum]|uniref:uncharacterized protein LOC124681946 isoform X2 n=1 Tax=Lolium rigidum TaxID=89674 RepID=UPI001F5C5D6E|nr:uncharacterized protein LOC124681946 isoform X2 [Lolium rigidum]
MADFALGLTKMAMEGTVSRVKLAIEEEKKLRVRVQNDLVFITGEFEMMQSFLKVANVKGAQNEVVRTWARQIRDLAFDVEDCVEFVVHLDKKTSLGWLRRFGLMVVSCDAPPLPLDKAVDDIKDIKARVEDVCQRNVRYNLIVDSGSNSTKPMSLAEQPDRANTCRSAFYILREVWEDMGKCRSNRMDDLEKLIKSRDSDLQVISVWGSAGTADLGVASILMKAYNDPEICERFNTRAWVKLMTPFQPDEFIKSMLTQVCARSGEYNLGAEFLARMKSALDMEDAQLKAKLMRQLMSGLRYLVILEQVSTVVEWDVIKSYLPDSNNGSRVIVSTNQLQIALLCTGKPYQVSELTRFSDDQSLCAFSKKSGRGSGTRELIWQIRCRGLTSVWGSNGDIKSTIVHKVYTSIMYKSKQFEGVEFERHSWVDVPVPFNLEVFSRRLLLNFRSQDLQVDEIAAVGMMRDPGLTEECCKFLRENDCLVVINGLQSTNEWDVIKDAFLSKPIKGCILAITNEERVAGHCVDNEDRAISIKDLETDPVLRALIKGCQYYETEDKEVSRRGRFFSVRREEARDWFKKETKRVFNHFLLENHVTSVWGTSCPRKSDIVRNKYYAEILSSEESLEREDEDDQRTHRLQGRKFRMFSWVYVQHPFNLINFSRRLLLDFHSDDLQSKRSAAVGIMEGQDPIQGCCEFLRKYKCLVVVDGLGSRDDWDSIRDAFLSEPTKGWIIVITNNENVAKYVVSEEQHAFNAQDLEGETVRFHPLIKMAQDCKELTPTGSEHIVAKCGGILKVIDAIRKLFAKEITPSGGQSEGMSREAKKLLNDINGDFMGTLEKDPKFHSLRGLFAWMQYYFDALSDSLKPCIFYMSVFPAKHNIRRRRLLRRWIAEGYSRDTSDKVAEENGERLFSELVDLSIIQHLETKLFSRSYEEKGSSVLCQVNAFFHEYIISRQMEDNLVFALDGHCSLNSQHAGQHLTIRSSWDRDEVVFRGIDVSRLRSLTVFGDWKPFLISEKMRLVRVLDLEEATDVAYDDLEHIGKLLPRLKFLSLRGHKKISLLPESLCGLRQLQTLDVRGTSVIKLPLGISKLQKLQYIRAGTILTKDEGDDTVATSQTADVDQISTPAEDTARVQEAVSDGVRTSTTSSWSRPQTLVSSWLSKFQKPRHDSGSVKVPVGIGSLTALHTLGVVNVAAGKAALKELKNLTQLRKLGVSGIYREHWPDFCSAISGYAHLESLSVRVDEDKGGLFARFGDISEPPKTLKSLKAYGHVQISPVWLLQLQNIRKVNFGLSILTQRDIEEHELDNSLSIENGYLNMFRVLEIECTSRLELSFGKRRDWVKVLKIQCSSGSSLQISLLENLIWLKEVWLGGFYHDDLKQDLERQLSSHPNEPVLKTEEPRSS